MTATQDHIIVELQRTIAALRKKLDEREAEHDAALARRDSDYDERIVHQAATIDVLKAMSASPGDPQPVFDLISVRARDICGAYGVTVCEFDGSLLHWRAATGVSEDPAVRTAARAGYPRPPARDWPAPRVILDRAIVHIRDHDADPALRRSPVWDTVKSSVGVPMMRGGVPIGTLHMGSREKGGFSDSQVDLLKTFAEQAVIAITSAETYRALRTRTADLQQSLEYQTATSDVLKVISRSTFDPRPVLAMLAETAARLCEAEQAAIYRREDKSVRMAANFGYPKKYEETIRARGAFLPVGVSVSSRAMFEGQVVHVHDATRVPGYPESAIKLGKVRTTLGVPLMREGETIGVITLARRRVEPFTDRQIELVSTFADQAVIAIENTRLINEQREALEQQTATAEVLQVINASPGNLTPVFDAMLEKVTRLCEAHSGFLWTYDGERYHTVATRNLTPAFEAFLNEPRVPGPTTGIARLASGEAIVHFEDATKTEAYKSGDPLVRATAELGGFRTVLIVPMRKDGVLLGGFSIDRQEVRPFAPKQIELVRTFAAQAEIAMENARLIDEQREALEQQTATAEVLQAINASPGNLTPVFDAMLDRAMRLCGAKIGAVYHYNGDWFDTVALRGVTPGFAAFSAQHPLPRTPGSPPSVVLETRRPAQVADIAATDRYRDGTSAYRRALVDTGGIRAFVSVPLLKDGTVLGFITIYRAKPGSFSDKQIALLESFAAQAVIAMENARLLEEIHQRQEELRVTFENMGDGVAMFNETQHLVAWNRKFQDILEVPDDVIARRRTFPEYVRYLADRGEYGPGTNADEQVRRLIDQAGQARAYERTRPDGRVIEIRHNPVPAGGFVLIYADITERKRNEEAIRAARDAAEATLRELKVAQANLIQAEKMASLGQLTAGIAHEIKNPLNFINNFAELSVDLLDELNDAVAPARAVLTEDQCAEIADVSAMLTGNLRKINEHGKRADGIVKAMLEHSRGASAERRTVDINTLVDEALNLAYHGARAQDQSFNITLERDYAAGIAPIEINPQDMTRVLLNLVGNGFYAASQRASSGAPGFEPTLRVTTRAAGDRVEIRVRDNGTGIPAEIREKLFQPFFTTKPSGQGTGLGLSITYDIVTKAHGGTIAVESEVDGFTEFVVSLPRRMFAN